MIRRIVCGFSVLLNTGGYAHAGGLHSESHSCGEKEKRQAMFNELCREKRLRIEENIRKILASDPWNVEKVRMMLNEDARLEERHPKSGDTPLLWAARHGHEELVALAIERGANVHFFKNKGSTALRFMILHKSLQLVNSLIKSGADLEAVDQYGITPVLYAAMGTRGDIVAELVRHGAHVEGIISSTWRERYDYFLDRIKPFMKQARKLAQQRTWAIRMLLEDEWELPKILSRFIVELSNTEWYQCAALDIPCASLLKSTGHIS